MINVSNDTVCEVHLLPEYSLFGSAEKEIEFFVHFAAKTFSIMTLSTLCHYHVVVC